MKPKTRIPIARTICALLAGVLLGGSGLVVESRPSKAGALPRVAQSPLPAHQQRADRRAVLMDVSVERPSAAPFILKLVLKYTGDKEVAIYKSSLPWENTYILILTAVEADATGTPLESYFRIDDPGPSTMTVKPGQVLVGEIDLTRRFRNLSRAIQQRDVIIFWSYQFRPIDGAPPPRIGGWLVIPKAARTRWPAGFDPQRHGTVRCWSRRR